MEPLTVMIINEKMAWSHETNVHDCVFWSRISNADRPNITVMPNFASSVEKIDVLNPRLSEPTLLVLTTLRINVQNVSFVLTKYDIDKVKYLRIMVSRVISFCLATPITLKTC